jgi:outer membrane protein assembly factor BamB
MWHDGMTRKLVLAAAGLLGIAGLANAGEWTRFRGPNGTGISTDKNVPVEIAENRNLLWKVRIPGSGNSSPIVGSGRIFLQTASEDGNQRMLLCIRLADGEKLWTRTAAGLTAKMHMKNTLASSSAAIDGNRVFMPFWDGKELSLSAYDLDGTHLWTTPLGPYVSPHGAGHSPIVVGGKVILLIDQDGASDLFAFNPQNGDVLWRKIRTPSKTACYSTPFLLEESGAAPEIVVASSPGLAAYNPANGAEKWRWNWTTNSQQLRTVGSPIVAQGLIFFSGGNGPGDRHAVAVRLNGKGSDLSTQPAEWEIRKMFPYVPCMLSQGEHLYFVNDSGIAGCYVARTCEKVWEQRLGIGEVVASPLLIDGRVYAIGETGGIRVFAAATEYSEITSGQLDEGVKATPAVADGRLIVRGAQHLYCFGKK